jgi:hypothetical protein
MGMGMGMGMGVMQPVITPNTQVIVNQGIGGV